MNPCQGCHTRSESFWRRPVWTTSTWSRSSWSRRGCGGFLVRGKKRHHGSAATKMSNDATAAFDCPMLDGASSSTPLHCWRRDVICGNSFSISFRALRITAAALSVGADRPGARAGSQKTEISHGPNNQSILDQANEAHQRRIPENGRETLPPGEFFLG